MERSSKSTCRRATWYVRILLPRLSLSFVSVSPSPHRRRRRRRISASDGRCVACAHHQVTAAESLLTLISELKQAVLLHDFETRNAEVTTRAQQYRDRQDKTKKARLPWWHAFSSAPRCRTYTILSVSCVVWCIRACRCRIGPAARFCKRCTGRCRTLCSSSAKSTSLADDPSTP